MMQVYRLFLTGLSLLAMVAGCGSSAVPPAVSSAPVAMPVVAENKAGGDVESPAAVPPGTPPPADADAERIARQAEEHAKAIEALLAARAREDVKSRGVRVIEPMPRDVDPAPVAPQPKTVAIEQPKNDPFESPAPSSEAQANTPVSVVAAVAPAAETKVIAVARSPEPAPAAPAGKEDSVNQQLAKRAREYPRDLAGQLDYQLSLFLKDEQVPRAADVAGLASEDREILTALLDGLANFRGAIRADNNLLMTRKVRPLLDMSDRLRSRADLNIPVATLCREVKGFGAYTPIEPLRFEAGLAHKTIVYAEIENFSSQLNDKNVWETRLKQELVLYTESGLPVWDDKISAADTCRNRRRDFFLVRVIQLPANLNVGRFVLKVSVTDEQSSRIAETSIPIAVVAK